jgi:hypothetical protein
MLMELRGITKYNAWTILGLHALMILGGVFLNALLTFDNIIGYFTFNNTLADPAFWFGNVLIVVAAVLPVVAIKRLWWCESREQMLQMPLSHELEMGRCVCAADVAVCLFLWCRTR